MFSVKNLSFVLLFCLFFIQHLNAVSTGCGSFNPNILTCCNGVLSAGYGFSTGCCGTKSYNKNFLTCCNGVVSAGYGFSTGCCGTKSYNKNLPFFFIKVLK